jgi:hypothetical protein
VARLQGRQPAAIFYPFGHPTPYAFAPSGVFEPYLRNPKKLTFDAPGGRGSKYLFWLRSKDEINLLCGDEEEIFPFKLFV